MPRTPRPHPPAEPPDPLASSRGSGTVARAAALLPDTAPDSGLQPEALAGDAIHRAYASLHTVLDVSFDLVMVHRGGCVIYANPAASRALDIASNDKLVGAPLLDLVHADDRAYLETQLIHPAASATQNATAEVLGVRWRRKGGGHRTTEAVATPVDFEGSEAVLVVANDITERGEFQHRLLERDRMAALGTLSAGVAHEVNNPLTYLLVNLEHVLRRLRVASASDDPVAELYRGDGGDHGRTLSVLVQALQQAVDGANRIRQIVRDLLTFAQGNVEHRGMIDVRGIVESAVQMTWHEIRHRARLAKNLAEVPPVDANEARLGQVFINLLVNAAQAIPEGHADEHEIRVSTRTDVRGAAVVEVSDTGVGIAPETMPRIFDPFFTTKGDSGTGLGLAISYGTVRGLGGDIVVQSIPGQGTTFRVILPPAKSWRSSTAPTSGCEPRMLGRPRLLVIDDERLVGDAIARSLSDDNEVEVVTDAQQGLARIGAGKHYDLVLCDLMMPVMTGMDLYAEIVRTAPELAGRIVFMTGGAFTSRARAFLQSVVNQCLEKPLDMAKLRSLLARAGRANDGS